MNIPKQLEQPLTVLNYLASGSSLPAGDQTLYCAHALSCDIFLGKSKFAHDAHSRCPRIAGQSALLTKRQEMTCRTVK